MKVKDMMNRWWSMKGSKATIKELQRSLELAQMFYISESTPIDETENRFAEIKETCFDADEKNGMLNAVEQKYNQTVNGNVNGGKTSEEITSEKPLKKTQTTKKSSKALKKPRNHDILETPGETTFSASERNNATALKKDKKPVS